MEVRDLPSSMEFYQLLLDRQASIVPFNDDGSDAGAFFNLDGNIQIILAYQQNRVPNVNSEAIWLEFEVSDAQNLRKRATLSNFGPGPLNMSHNGTYGFDLRDPDGRRIRVSESR